MTFKWIDDVSLHSQDQSIGDEDGPSSVASVTMGIAAAIWGDKFLLGFMSLLKYLR
jgi:hypothetical protein